MAKTFHNLKTYCRDHGYSDDTTRGNRNLEKLINDSIREVVESHDWPHLTKRLGLRTEAPYSTGTVAATHGSTTITGTGTTWTQKPDQPIS